MLLLGEALDLVTTRQGFKSPALVPLVTALIKRVRVLGSVAPGDDARAGEPVQPVAEDETPSQPAAPASKPEREPETEQTTVDAGTGAEAGDADVAAEAPSSQRGLEDQLATRDKKLAALTLAVGQLVNVLQRRSWSGGIDRRDAPRVSGQDARVFINDRPYDVINWSTKGFLIKVRDVNRIGVRDFDFHFVLELSDETIEFQGRAKTVRIEGDTLAAQFEQLDKETNAKIAQIMTGLRGPAE
jgi:hypothetical protein